MQVVFICIPKPNTPHHDFGSSVCGQSRRVWASSTVHVLSVDLKPDGLGVLQTPVSISSLAVTGHAGLRSGANVAAFPIGAPVARRQHSEIFHPPEF